MNLQGKNVRLYLVDSKKVIGKISDVDCAGVEIIPQSDLKEKTAFLYPWHMIDHIEYDIGVTAFGQSPAIN